MSCKPWRTRRCPSGKAGDSQPGMALILLPRSAALPPHKPPSHRAAATPCQTDPMDSSWDDRVASFWASADDENPDLTLTAMRQLVEERPKTDPDALYEWASVHDFLGRGEDAVPLYRAALDGGLSGDREPQAIIQLASSLRNVGEPSAAVGLLQSHPENPITGSAAQAFLALALHSRRGTERRSATSRADRTRPDAAALQPSNFVLCR